MKQDDLTSDDRAVLYQHVVLLTAGGMSPIHALAVAAETAVMMNDDPTISEALEHARLALLTEDNSQPSRNAKDEIAPRVRKRPQ